MGLEMNIILSQDEICDLILRDIKGVIRFRDQQSRGKVKREIPIVLRYLPGEREIIDVSQQPANVYFGEAKHITITINDYSHQQLCEAGVCGDRFYGAEGKVIIERA